MIPILLWISTSFNVICRKVNEPSFSDAEHQHFMETMRKAGFPACASPAALAKFAKPQRLPECEKGAAN